MDEKRRRFADLLSAAIQRIKKQEGKPINLIQDELGYHVHLPALVAEEQQSGKLQEKGAGTTIEYWRKGNIPPSHAKIERLARELVRRAGMEQSWLKDFLDAASFGTGSEELIEELFGSPIHPSISKTPPTYENAPAPFQAPALTPHFVGREAEFAQLEAMLNNAQSPRIVALVGMGGIGKTTLAVGLAHRLRARFKDGVLWGHAATSDPLDILNLWAKAYGCDFSGQSDLQNRAAAVRGLLAEKETLIVIDDVTTVERVRPLLPNSPHAIVLLTTRNEEVAVGLDAQIISLQELLPDDGVGLLTEILGEKRVENEAEAAQIICQRLHHLPLAVEIAAQFLRARNRRSLHDLAAQLEDMQLRLDLAIADRAVRTSFLISWEMLDESQRACFAHMAVFAGRPFTLDALSAVLTWDQTRTQNRLEMLRVLSLVKEEGATHYRQHPLLADFAQEQLQKETSTSIQAQQQMAHYYLDFAAKHQTNYTLLEPEWDNLMAGMETAHRQQEWAMVVKYAETLTEPWFAQAEYTRARKGSAWAVEGAEKLNNAKKLARIKIWHGYACSEQGDVTEAQQLLADGMAIAQRENDDECVSDAQYHLSRFALDNGDYEATDELLTSCAELRQRLGNLRGLAAVQCQQADLYFRNQHYAKAEELCHTALAIQEQEQDFRELINTLRLLSDLANKKDEYVQATQYTLQALTLAQQHNLRGEIAIAYFSLAVIARCQKQFHQSLQYCEQAQVIFQQLGNRAFLAATLYEACVVLKLIGQLDTALEKGEASLSILVTLRDEYNRTYCIFHLGDIYDLLGKQEKAIQLWQEGYELAKRLQHPFLPRYEQTLKDLAKRNKN